MKYENQPVEEVVWNDTCLHDSDKEKVNNGKAKDFIIPTRTYGRVLKEDKDALILVCNENVTDNHNKAIDFYAIPKGMIIKRIQYREIRR